MPSRRRRFASASVRANVDDVVPGQGMIDVAQQFRMRGRRRRKVGNVESGPRDARREPRA